MAVTTTYGAILETLSSTVSVHRRGYKNENELSSYKYVNDELTNVDENGQNIQKTEKTFALRLLMPTVHCETVR